MKQRQRSCADVEIVKLVGHLVISVIVLFGGGTIYVLSPSSKSEMMMLIGAVVFYWFGRAGNGNGYGAEKKKAPSARKPKG